MLDRKSDSEEQPSANLQQEMQEEVISNAYNEAVLNPEAFEQHRLSEGKIIMLEHFKQSIISYQSIQDNNDEAEETNDENLKKFAIPFKAYEKIILAEHSGVRKQNIKQSMVSFEGIQEIILEESYAGQKEKLESIKQSVISFEVPSDIEEKEEVQSFAFKKKHATLAVSQKPCFGIKEEEDQSERSNKQGQSEADHQSQIKVQPQQRNKIKDSIASTNQRQGPLQETTLQVTPTFVFPALNHKETLEASIRKAICCLCKGVRVFKCCLNRFKVEQCVLCFQESFNFISLRVLGKEEEKVYNTAGFEQVIKGAHTVNFKRYLQEDPTLNSDQCFTIALSDRKFDFIAKSTTQRDSIVREIEFLMNCYE